MTGIGGILRARWKECRALERGGLICSFALGNPQLSLWIAYVFILMQDRFTSMKVHLWGWESYPHFGSWNEHLGMSECKGDYKI